MNVTTTLCTPTFTKPEEMDKVVNFRYVASLYVQLCSFFNAFFLNLITDEVNTSLWPLMSVYGLVGRSVCHNLRKRSGSFTSKLLSGHVFTFYLPIFCNSQSLRFYFFTDKACNAFDSIKCLNSTAKSLFLWSSTVVISFGSVTSLWSIMPVYRSIGRLVCHNFFKRLIIYWLRPLLFWMQRS